MKSAPIQRLREKQKEKRNGRGKTQVQKSPVISEKSTTFFIGQKEYSYSFSGFAKAIAQGLFIILGMAVVLFLLCILYFSFKAYSF